MTHKPRKLWQMHLSTLLFCSIVSGVLLGLNFRKVDSTTVSSLPGPTTFSAWPYRYVENWDSEMDRDEYRHARDAFSVNKKNTVPMNILVCVGIVLVAGAAFEYAVRRRNPN